MTETKTQRHERLKREKNPWEALEELRGYARGGFDAIPPEWISTYLRWWGVYTQGDGAGVIGGANGVGKAVPRFMVRIRIPNGLLRADQLRAIAEASDSYGNGIADITVRQNVQLHWVTAEALPDLLDALWRHGLTTKGSCGDDTRNITGCPLAGLDADEICDASPLALAANEALIGDRELY
ncbi:MAG TPA: nitrite reductase, partial [Rhodothermia bacterium]|nr:nitrite reductase [Rhodothermia bacterium]